MITKLTRPLTATSPRYTMQRSAVIALLASLVGMFVLAASVRADAAHTFVSQSLGLEIRWPDSFDRAPQQNGLAAAAILLLTYKNGYPTFNVVRATDTLSADPAQEVLDSYKKVGFTDAQISSQFVSPQGWPGIEMTYHATPSTLLHSSVVLIPQRHSYFVLTFVDTEYNMGEHRPLFDQLLAGTTIEKIDSGLASQASSAKLLLLGAIAALVISALIAAMILKRRRKAPPVA